MRHRDWRSCFNLILFGSLLYATFVIQDHDFIAGKLKTLKQHSATAVQNLKARKGQVEQAAANLSNNAADMQVNPQQKLILNTCDMLAKQVTSLSQLPALVSLGC